MANPLELHLEIKISYLDRNLMETAIKYSGFYNIEEAKAMLRVLAANLSHTIETHNGDIGDGL